MMKLLLVALLVAGCAGPVVPSSSPAVTVVPTVAPTTTVRRTTEPSIGAFMYERDGAGIVLEAVAVPAGRYSFGWAAAGSCDYEVSLGVKGQDAPTWLTIPIDVTVRTADSGNGDIVLSTPIDVVLLSGTGCQFSFVLERA